MDDAIVVSAIATSLLAFFALVQLGLEMWRGYRGREAARTRVRGQAWLARRTLESILDDLDTVPDLRTWARGASDEKRFDRVEAQLLAVVNAAGDAGGVSEQAAANAWVDFLGFADHVNRLAALAYTGDDKQGGVEETTEDSLEAIRLANEATVHARSAVRQLEHFAPRLDHEQQLRSLKSYRLLRGA